MQVEAFARMCWVAVSAAKTAHNLHTMLPYRVSCICSCHFCLLLAYQPQQGLGDHGQGREVALIAECRLLHGPGKSSGVLRKCSRIRIAKSERIMFNRLAMVFSVVGF